MLFEDKAASKPYAAKTKPAKVTKKSGSSKKKTNNLLDIGDEDSVKIESLNYKVSPNWTSVTIPGVKDWALY